ncbi:dephospho-CoA kinase [Flaviaesturariibacter flavus]|uniref:Dephospho-CoA kinase n=1 Tax=Flaviaesturariibacter flavus TaxID=2502780 RepID=A0A4R1BA43_9BACT|nr:dephospho-CoA kinase [Flaviaesturariibacter flavus]TCJ13803.1 dephospho-CoA kinase [Flaviaesturariibacter flavus]
MLKVGLTGGIGSGKSVVARVFAELGVPVYDADAASKRLYATHAGLQQALREHFGADIFNEKGLDRARLAGIVFNNPEQLELLNALVHPPTIEDAENWMRTQSKHPYVIKEAALFFEAGSAAGLDYIIGVDAPAHLRLQRAMRRDGVTREEVQARMKRQIDPVIKMMLCDFVIKNDEQQLVIPQVLELHEKLLSLSLAKPTA